MRRVTHVIAQAKATYQSEPKQPCNCLTTISRAFYSFRFLPPAILKRMVFFLPTLI